MAKCNWEPFFEELTDYILSFKNDRKTLLDNLRLMYGTSGVEAPVYAEGNIDISDTRIDNIDPFTVLTFIVDGQNVIRQNCEAINNLTQFGFANKFPLGDYDGYGIPPSMQGQKRLTWYFFDKRPDNDATIEYLWKLFEASVNLRINYSEATKQEFVLLYNQFPSYIQKKYKVPALTDLLILIAPSQLAALDKFDKEYIISNYPDLEKLANKVTSDFDGDSYLELCEKLREKIGNDKTFGDITYLSFEQHNTLKNKQKFESEQSEKDIIDCFNEHGVPIKYKKSKSSCNYLYVCPQMRNKKLMYYIAVKPSFFNGECYFVLNDASNSSVYLFYLRFPDDIDIQTLKPIRRQKDSDDKEIKVKFEIIQDGFKFADRANKINFSNYFKSSIEYDYNDDKFVCSKYHDSVSETIPEVIEPETTKEINQNIDVESGNRDIIFYGIPGCGKSYLVNEEKIDKNHCERIVFYPDYMNSDFVGQILPQLYTQGTEQKVKYGFVAGPFTRILGQALKDKAHNYFLVIEELNRGNAAAIFGDIFQLLDRDDKSFESRYAITNKDISDWINDTYKVNCEKIKLPANLFIYATMNTSDQNVYPLDTAFQRRWTMEYVPDDMNHCPWRSNKIGGDNMTNIAWEKFHDKINDKIKSDVSIISTDDKRLGSFFCSEREIKDIDLFTNKVLKYLWDDAFKLRRNEIFSESLSSFEDLVKKVNDNKKSINEQTETEDNQPITVFDGVFIQGLFD